MRRHWGAEFPLVSLGTVFGLQGLLMWIVSLPVQVVNGADSQSIGVLAGVGVALWLVGLTFETVGDVQLAQFKANPDWHRRPDRRLAWNRCPHRSGGDERAPGPGVGILPSTAKTRQRSSVGPRQ